MDAGAIVGLLADADRRRCFAAVELGASTRDEVAATAGLTSEKAAKALSRLVAGGLVRSGAGGGLEVAGDGIRLAAREALARPESGEHDQLPDDARKVMKSFVVDGRLTRIPTAPGKRRVILDWLAQEFDPGVRYSEAMVNLTLGQRFADTAALRRYLVDEGFLSREAGQYWRSGGTVG